MFLAGFAAALALMRRYSSGPMEAATRAGTVIIVEGQSVAQPLQLRRPPAAPDRRSLAALAKTETGGRRDRPAYVRAFCANGARCSRCAA